MDEQIQEAPAERPQDKPRKPRKARRIPRRAVSPAAAKPPAPGTMPAEFAGLTLVECCDACHATGRCVITKEGSGLCGHPRKGGIQTRDMVVHAISERYMRVKKLLGHLVVEMRAS